MKNLELIRKMDSMGRIVIPKDIRKKLNIVDEDSLKLTFNEDHLEIRKYLYEDLFSKAYNFVNCTKDLLDAKVLLISNKNLNNIPSKILNIVNDRKEYQFFCNEKISIDDNELSGFLYVIPVIKNSEIISLAIFQKNNDFNNIDLFYMDILKRFVESI